MLPWVVKALVLTVTTNITAMTIMTMAMNFAILLSSCRSSLVRPVGLRRLIRLSIRCLAMF